MSISFVWAQSPTDSSAILAVDTIIEPTPAPVVKTFDTLGISVFDLEFADGKLNITAKTINGQAIVPAKFYSNIEIGEEALFPMFENGKASMDYAANFTGELVSVRAKYTACKVKSCPECDPKTHAKQDEIICLDYKQTQLVHVQKRKNGNLRIQPIALWWSIIPPLAAIFLALLFRQVLLALFMGIMAGAWIVGGMQMSPYGLMKSFFSVIDHYIIGALNSSSHLAVIVFSIMIGGVVAIISRNGGMQGVVEKLEPLAKGPKSTQFVVWLLGVAIFFDDYANSLIVGNTMRPLTDKYSISREKLAYIVDSTAAPISAVAFITTWIGAELGYISDAIPLLTGLENAPSAYSMFLSSLSYSFYSFFTLVFILIIIYTGRDYGAMFKAEKRARTTGRVFVTEGESITDADMEELEPVANATPHWLNGFLPIFMVVFGTLMGLIDTGMQSCYDGLIDLGVNLEHSGWGEVWSNMHNLDASGEAGFVRKMGILIGNSDSYAALLWASMSAIVLALILTVSQRIMTMAQSVETVIHGFKTMMPALLILILAWSLATTTEELATAEFLTNILGDTLSPYMVPVVVFILAALIAFSTGSSWSTMAILYPIAIPLTWTISQNAGIDMDTSMELLYNVIAVVLAASVLGDHCSPISDTTILSSLASNCNHIDHVKTQLPYAMTVGIISLFMTYVSTRFAIPFIINFAIGVGMMFGIIMLLGKKVPDIVKQEPTEVENIAE
jgi:Na+/H+ antiporter NhaC